MSAVIRQMISTSCGTTSRSRNSAPRAMLVVTEDQPPVEPVDVDAGDGAEDDRGHQEAQDQQADRGALAGQREDLDRQAEEDHVAADLGDDLRDPERQELAVAQNGDGATLCLAVLRPTRTRRLTAGPRSMNALQPTLELSPLDQHAVLATLAHEADVGARGARRASRCCRTDAPWPASSDHRRGTRPAARHDAQNGRWWRPGRPTAQDDADRERADDERDHESQHEQDAGQSVGGCCR